MTTTTATEEPTPRDCMLIRDIRFAVTRARYGDDPIEVARRIHSYYCGDPTRINRTSKDLMLEHIFNLTDVIGLLARRLSTYAPRTIGK